MTYKTIFLTFANNRDNPLPALKKEDEGIYSFLDQRTKDANIRIHRDSYCTKPSIREHMSDKKERLILFHYSGHGSLATLSLEDSEANVEGFNALLSLAPNVKIIFLNACDTNGLGSQLTELPSKPAIIYTTTIVPDELAYQFSKTFYKALCDGDDSIKKAFDAAKAVLKLETIEEWKTRGMGKRKSGEVYFLACKDENLINLPFSEILEETPIDFEVNSILTEMLLETYEAYDEGVRGVFQGGNNSISSIQSAILKTLPHPISEQLRKLFAIRLSHSLGEKQEENVFYIDLGFSRLEQIVYTCFTLLELLSFIHLSQLWDEINQTKIKVEEQEQAVLFELFKQIIEKKDLRAIFCLIKKINGLYIKLKGSEVQNFIEEFNIDQLIKNEKFKTALGFFQKINQEIAQNGNIPENKAALLCKEAEEMLGIIYGELAFIVYYKMTSIQSVKFMSYRHTEKANYDFEKVELIQELERVKRIRVPDNPEACHTRSVFLSYKLKKEKKPLNLTPFLIDENAFPYWRSKKNENNMMAKICSFNSFESYQFRHIYKPKEQVQIRERSKLSRFNMVKEQLDKFALTVFNRKVV